ncbi:MAG: transcriptional regulator [Hyphomicrobiales bacterium]|nr:MAG: transcriptional regulator [Hyphomicrobiales bacterium]
MQTQEADFIARFLNVPVSEILGHAGFARDLDGFEAPVVLAAIIDETGRVQRLREPRPLPQRVLDKARSSLGESGRLVIAAQIRAETGPLAVWDDAVILFSATTRVEPDAIGELAVVRLLDGEQMFCRIDRARKTGEATLRLPEGGLRDVLLDTAAPLLALVP